MEDRFETFTVLINRISRNIRKIKNQEMAEYHLRSPHVSCLYHLYLQEGLTAAELCGRCEEDKATISRALDDLEEAGCLACRGGSAKRYRNPLELTEKGREVGKRIADKITGILEEVSRGLNPEDREIFYRSLKLISSNLETVAKNRRKKG